MKQTMLLLVIYYMNGTIEDYVSGNLEYDDDDDDDDDDNDSDGGDEDDITMILLLLSQHQTPRSFSRRSGVL